MDDREILQQLQQASQGLLWLSESDYPFEIVYWQDKKSIVEEKLLQNNNKNSDKTIEIIIRSTYINLPESNNFQISTFSNFQILLISTSAHQLINTSSNLHILFLIIQSTRL